jgi:hypothetical protein
MDLDDMAGYWYGDGGAIYIDADGNWKSYNDAEDITAGSPTMAGTLKDNGDGTYAVVDDSGDEEMNITGCEPGVSLTLLSEGNTYVFKPGATSDDKMDDTADMSGWWDGGTQGIIYIYTDGTWEAYSDQSDIVSGTTFATGYIVENPDNTYSFYTDANGYMFDVTKYTGDESLTIRSNGGEYDFTYTEDEPQPATGEADFSSLEGYWYSGDYSDGLLRIGSDGTLEIYDSVLDAQNDNASEKEQITQKADGTYGGYSDDGTLLFNISDIQAGKSIDLASQDETQTVYYTTLDDALAGNVSTSDTGTTYGINDLVGTWFDDDYGALVVSSDYTWSNYLDYGDYTDDSASASGTIEMGSDNTPYFTEDGGDTTFFDIRDCVAGDHMTLYAPGSGQNIYLFAEGSGAPDSEVDYSSTAGIWTCDDGSYISFDGEGRFEIYETADDTDPLAAGYLHTTKAGDTVMYLDTDSRNDYLLYLDGANYGLAFACFSDDGKSLDLIPLPDNAGDPDGPSATYTLSE